MARQVQRIENNWNRYSPDVAAKPVDTYVTPERVPQDSSFNKLASALSDIHKPLRRFAKDRFDEKQAEDEATGTKLYHERGLGLSWADFRDADASIPNSQAMKKGYLAARMSNEAALLRQTLEEAYEKGEASVKLPNGEVINVALSDDPAAFDTWMRRSISNYIQQNLGDHIPSDIFTSVFVPQMNEYTKSLTGKHINNRSNIIQTQLESEIGGLMYNTVMAHVSDGKLTLGDEEGVQAVAAQISTQARAAMTSGLSLERTRNAVVAMLVGLAGDDSFENMDELFHLIKHIEIAPGISLGNMGNERMLLNKELHAAETRREQKEERAKRKKEEAANKARQEVWKEIGLLALQKKTLTRGQLEEKIKGMPDVTLREISSMLSRIKNILEFDKPPENGAGRGRTEAVFEKLFKFHVETGGNYDPETIVTYGVGELGIPWSYAYQLLQKSPGMNGPLSAIQDATVTQVYSTISVHALGGVPWNQDENTWAKTMAIQDRVYAQFKLDTEKDKRLLTDSSYAHDHMVGIAMAKAREMKDYDIGIFAGYSRDDAASKAKLEAGMKRQDVFNPRNMPSIKQNWAELEAEFRKAVARGEAVESTSLYKAVTSLGYTLDDYEAAQHKKLPRPVTQNKHVQEAEKQLSPEGHAYLKD